MFDIYGRNIKQDKRFQGLTHKTSMKAQWIQTERENRLLRSAVQLQQQLQFSLWFYIGDPSGYSPQDLDI